MLPQQVLEALAELPDEGVLLDATVGGGGTMFGATTSTERQLLHVSVSGPHITD